METQRYRLKVIKGKELTTGFYIIVKTTDENDVHLVHFSRSSNIIIHIIIIVPRIYFKLTTDSRFHSFFFNLSL